MRNKQILLSGRAVTTNAANVPADRYSFLHLSDAEPNLGTANANGWVLVYDTSTPGNRRWSESLITSYNHANAAYDSQNVTGTYANNAYAHANAAYQSQNVTGTYANNAYAHANASYIHANLSYLHANAAYESQNITGTYANNAYAHANSGYLHANAAYQSQNITGTYANNAYAHANAGYIHANSAYNSQNITGTYANAAYQHANLSYIHANSAFDAQNITGSYANSAYIHANLSYNHANAAYQSQNVTGTYANNAYAHANASYVHANSGYIHANAAYAQANSGYIHANAAFDAQNITGSYANSAYVRANNSLDANVGGLVTGNVTIQGTLSVTGNVYALGNAFFVDAGTLIANDTLLLLGLNNYTTDLLDIGLSGHYNDGSNAHTGLIRDAGTKEWHLFKGYTPDVSSNNNIDINHPSFIIDTLNANLHSEYVRVRGVEIGYYANAAFLQANSAYAAQNVTGTYANNAYDQANSAASYANGAFVQANSAYAAQNITGTYANNAYAHANAGYIHANSAFNAQNITGSYANSAYIHANSAYESQNITGIYANNAYAHANAAYASQNVTGTYANNAYLHANSAYESQNITGTYANNAYAHANAAYASQNVTGTYANNAYLHANASYIHANAAFDAQNTTGVYANAAFLKTNSAYQHANSAYDSQNVTLTYANSAYAHANAAFIAQNVTGTYANAAFIKANAAMFSITPNTNEIWVNTSTGNVQIGLANINSTIGTYGGATAIPVINVDGHGRIQSVSNTTISVPPGTYIFPNTNQLTTNANFGNVLIGLANVNLNIGTYGSEFAVPTITTDGYGRITAISNTTISIPQGTYIVNSNLITSNSSTGNVVLGLAESGVTAGVYGGAGKTPVLTVDVYGRVLVAANVDSSVNTLSTMVRSSFTATAAQTVFQTATSFEQNYADVYVNGIKLSSADYSQNGILGQVTINTPTLLDGDVVDIQTATTYIVNSNTNYQKADFVATAGQTTVTIDYVPGQVNVYLNGLRLQNGTDYTAVTGTTIVFPIALEVGDIVEVEKIGSAYIQIANSYFMTRNTISVTANGDSTFIVGGGYRVGCTDVYYNGIKLNIPADVTATDGSTITLVSGSSEVGDFIEIVGIGQQYSIANALPTTGGTIYGSLAITGNVSANHANIGTLHFSDGTSMITAASGSGGTGIIWKIVSANTTANTTEGLLVDTTSANVYITLNASPYLGNTTRIVDMTGNFAINNCIVKGNGQKIMGSTDDLIVSSNNAGIGLVYSNATHGWRIIENP
jgi:hypothetical protein